MNLEKLEWRLIMGFYVFHRGWRKMWWQEKFAAPDTFSALLLAFDWLRTDLYVKLRARISSDMTK